MGKKEVRDLEHPEQEPELEEVKEENIGEELEAEKEEAEEKTEEEKLQEELHEARAEAEDFLDKYRRSAATFSNYRKRQKHEQEQESIRIRMNVMRELLPIVDDFQRAAQNVPDEFAEVEWMEGIALIQRKMEALLDKHEVVPIEALGEPFDPNFHSALLQAESNEYPAGTVMEEVAKGYLLGDKVLRPTLVKVSLGPKAEAEEEDE